MEQIRDSPPPGGSPFIWVFVPYTFEAGRPVSPTYDTPGTRRELAEAFQSLGLAWAWQPVTLQDAPAVIARVAAAHAESPAIVLNFCDGNELDGEPGITVVNLLTAAGIPFTGAGPGFYHLSTSKILMKQAFTAAGVATPPYAIIDGSDHRIPGLCARLGTPLIVKPAISSASAGISLSSVVVNDGEIAREVARLLAGRHGQQFLPGAIFVERFIEGPEFTVFVVDLPETGRSPRHPRTYKVYPPVERVFHSALPARQRFLSFDRYWGYFREEAPLSPDEPFYRYRLVEGDLRERLCDVSRRACAALDGNGYARVDIRMERATGELFVLEVNANCGISSDDQTSVGQILALSGIPFARLLADILAARHLPPDPG